MTRKKWPPADETGGPSETATGGAISAPSIHNAPSFQKSDPGAFGLAVSIATLPTSDLREMVNLLTAYAPAFGFHGRRRRDLAMYELRRRMVVT